MPNYSHIGDRIRAWDVISRERPFWVRRVGDAQAKWLCDIAMSQAIEVGANLPETEDEFRKLIYTRAKKRVKDQVGNPILLFIFLQALGTIISLIVRDLYERWKKKKEEEEEEEETTEN